MCIHMHSTLVSRIGAKAGAIAGSCLAYRPNAATLKEWETEVQKWEEQARPSPFLPFPLPCPLFPPLFGPSLSSPLSGSGEGQKWNPQDSPATSNLEPTYYPRPRTGPRNTTMRMRCRPVVQDPAAARQGWHRRRQPWTKQTLAASGHRAQGTSQRSGAIAQRPVPHGVAPAVLEREGLAGEPPYIHTCRQACMGGEGGPRLADPACRRRELLSPTLQLHARWWCLARAW